MSDPTPQELERALAIAEALSLGQLGCQGCDSATADWVVGRLAHALAGHTSDWVGALIQVSLVPMHGEYTTLKACVAYMVDRKQSLVNAAIDARHLKEKAVARERERCAKEVRQAYINAALAATMALGFDAPPTVAESVASKIAARRDEHIAALHIGGSPGAEAPADDRPTTSGE